MLLLFIISQQLVSFNQVVPSSDVQILQKGKTLKLLKAAVADAGRYTCKAINIAGSTERDFYLDVLGKLFCNNIHLL